ncbi:MAG TPA: hypothetical protein VHD31_00710 [Candidatus Paceibacterota bacterium]|nr:hypothetical protein [Candidatus Paceibacterota bacterium]
MMITRVHNMPAFLIPGAYDLLRPVPVEVVQQVRQERQRPAKPLVVLAKKQPQVLLPASITTPTHSTKFYEPKKLDSCIVVVRRKGRGVRSPRVKFRVH